MMLDRRRLVTRKHPQLAALGIFSRRRDRRDGHRDVPAEQIGDRRAGPAVGHVHQLDAGHAGEQLARNMTDRADAGRSVVDLSRVGLGVSDQLRDRVHRKRGMHDNRRGRVADQPDRCEILAGIETGIGIDPRRDGEGAGITEHQRVAVRRGPGDLRGRNRAPGAAAVVDDELPAELFAELVGHDPRDDAGGAAGRERIDQRDWPGGISLLSGCTRDQQAQRHRKDEEMAERNHFGLLLHFFRFHSRSLGGLQPDLVRQSRPLRLFLLQQNAMLLGRACDRLGTVVGQPRANLVGVERSA